MMTNWFHVSAAAGDVHAIPVTVRYSFYLGAAAFFGAVWWTVITSREYVAHHDTAGEPTGVNVIVRRRRAFFSARWRVLA